MKTVKPSKTTSLLMKTGLLKENNGCQFQTVVDEGYYTDKVMITFLDGKTIGLTFEDFEDFHKKREQSIKAGLKMGMKLKVLMREQNEVLYLTKWLEKLKAER